MSTNYQQLYANGETKPGAFQRECKQRFEIIAPVLAEFSRRFSLFDLGANLGYFSLRAQHEYDCFAVAVDRPRPELVKLLADTSPDSLAWINRHFTAKHLSYLADCEQFDVGLALNVLHHYPTKQEALRALKAMKRLCRFLVLEICPPDGDDAAKNPELHGAIYQAVTSDKAATLLAKTKSHCGNKPPRYIYVIDSGLVGFTTHQSFDSRWRCPHNSECKVWQYLDREPEVQIVKADQSIDKVFEGQFIPGMNLWNLRLLGFGYPDALTLERKFAAVLQQIPHDDPMPWNWIYDGGIHPIDNGFKARQRKFPEDALAAFRHGSKAIDYDDARKAEMEAVDIGSSEDRS